MNFNIYTFETGSLHFYLGYTTQWVTGNWDSDFLKWIRISIDIAKKLWERCETFDFQNDECIELLKRWIFGHNPQFSNYWERSLFSVAWTNNKDLVGIFIKEFFPYIKDKKKNVGTVCKAKMLNKKLITLVYHFVIEKKMSLYYKNTIF